MKQQRRSTCTSRTFSEASFRPTLSALHWSKQKFQSFDSTLKLWKNYRSRFPTFKESNFIPEDKPALVFLTNQLSDIYKLIDNFALQLPKPTTANRLSLKSIHDFMSQHYDYKRFLVREQFRFCKIKLSVSQVNALLTCCRSTTDGYHL